MEANGTKDEIKAGILHNVEGYWVSNEGTKKEPSYHVWIPCITSSYVDSAYQDLSLAVVRCNYLARSKATIPHSKRQQYFIQRNLN